MFDANDNFPQRVTGDQMILCHTPLKRLAPQYHDKHVLVAGYGDIVSVALDHGFSKPVLAEELFALMPELCSLNQKVFAPSQLDDLRRTCLKRFGKETPEELLDDLKFSAIMMMADCFWHELHMQLFSDLIRSKDGRIGAKGHHLHYRKRTDPQVVQMYCTNPDLTYSDSFHHPRLSGQYPLMLSLKHLMQEAFGITPEVV